MKKSMALFVFISTFLICIPCHAGIDVADVRGEVKVLRDGESYDAKPRMNVRNGDVIITGKNEQLDVRWGSLWGCRILPESRMTVTGTRLKNQSVNLDEGGILFRFRKLPSKARFKLETPTAVSSVRGTVFMAKTDSQNDTYATLEGAVHIFSKTSDANIKLLSGQAIEIQKQDGSLGDVRPLSQDERTQLMEARKLKVSPKRSGRGGNY